MSLFKFIVFSKKLKLFFLFNLLETISAAQLLIPILPVKKPLNFLSAAPLKPTPWIHHSLPSGIAELNVTLSAQGMEAGMGGSAERHQAPPQEWWYLLIL